MGCRCLQGSLLLQVWACEVALELTLNQFQHQQRLGLVVQGLAGRLHWHFSTTSRQKSSRTSGFV
jgi:hypothetical protein